MLPSVPSGMWNSRSIRLDLPGRTRQNVRKSMDTYQARIRALAKYCEFTNLNRELKSHMIQTSVSTRLRRCAHAEPTIMLQQIMDARYNMETAEPQLKVIESSQKEATSSTVAVAWNDPSSIRL